MCLPDTGMLKPRGTRNEASCEWKAPIPTPWASEHPHQAQRRSAPACRRAYPLARKGPHRVYNVSRRTHRTGVTHCNCSDNGSSRQIRFVSVGSSAAHVAGKELITLRNLAHVSWVWVCAIQPLQNTWKTAHWDLNNLYRDLSDVSRCVYTM